MKWIVIVLLVGNVAVFSWQFNQHVKEQTAATASLPPLPPKTPSLRLVSELSELPPLRTTTSNNEMEGDAEEVIAAVDLYTELNSFGVPSDTCIDVGPFADEQQLDTFKNWVRTRATTVHTRMETVRERRFFWVYLEPESDAQAKKSLNDLKRRGVKDYMLVRRGGLKNAISLGLFRSQDSVNRRLAEMIRQGYKPVVVPQFKSIENYFVRATMALGYEDTSGASEALTGHATLETTACVSTTNPTQIGELYTP